MVNLLVSFLHEKKWEVVGGVDSHLVQPQLFLKSTSLGSQKLSRCCDEWI